MATSTKFRPVAKLIDAASMPLWVIDAVGRLVFVSAATGEWLGVEPESLLGRLCLAGASISDDPLDYLAASLSAPPGFGERGTASLLIQPSSGDPKAARPQPMDTRFVRLGSHRLDGGNDAANQGITFAFAGVFDDQDDDPVIDASAILRQQLDSWRRHHDHAATTALLGESRLANRTRLQADLASKIRSHVAVLSPPGCQSESVVSWVQQRSAFGEPIANIDGPLMDAELLDASLGILSQYLGESEDAHATAVLKDADETPLDAQLRLVEWVQRYEGRLRLIAICGPRPAVAIRPTVAIRSDSETSPTSETLYVDDELPPGIDVSLADILCGLTITLYPLSARVEDIPLIATAMLDRRRASADHAKGEITADRFARSALDAMVLYPWPDNLREMDQSIRHAVRVCRGEAISIEHFPLAVRSYRPNESIPISNQSIDLDRVVARYESELIRKTLDESDGNRAEAARRLNISRARLLRKLEIIDKETQDE